MHRLQELATGDLGRLEARLHAVAAMIYSCSLQPGCTFSLLSICRVANPSQRSWSKKGCLWLVESKRRLNNQTTHHEKDRDTTGLRHRWNQELQCWLSVCRLLPLFPCALASFFFTTDGFFQMAGISVSNSSWNSSSDFHQQRRSDSLGSSWKKFHRRTLIGLAYIRSHPWTNQM